MVALFNPQTRQYVFQVSEAEMMQNPKVWYEVYLLVRQKAARPVFEQPKQLEEAIPCLEGILCS